MKLLHTMSGGQWHPSKGYFTRHLHFALKNWKIFFPLANFWEKVDSNMPLNTLILYT